MRGSGWSLLDVGSATRRWGAMETILLLLWLSVAGFGVAQHVPWADEIQAWLLAGEQSWTGLFTHALHYEGTGGLWHAFLKLLHAGGLSFTAARWLAAAVQGAAVVLLLGYAPLPRLVRWLLPFTFFLLYQDAIVARSYCLFGLFAFGAASLLRDARPRPVLLALLLGVFANLSIHAAIASGGLALAAALTWRHRLLKSAPALLLLLTLWAVSVATLVPAFDIDFAAGNNLRRSFAKVESQLGLHAVAPPPLIGMPMAGLPQAPLPVHVRHGFPRVWNRVSRMLSVVTYPVASSRLLALLLVACILVQACVQSHLQARQRRLALAPAVPDFVPGPIGAAGLLPYGLLVLVFASLYLAPRHAGTIFTGLIVTAWLTWPAEQAGAERAGPRSASWSKQLLLARSTGALWVLVCILQICWSAAALFREHSRPYAPGAMTAAYLHAQGVGQAGSDKSIAGYYYYSIDPLLAFPHALYINQPAHRYWEWSTPMRTYSTVQRVLAQHPDFVVIGGFESGPDAEITRDWEPVPPPLPGIVRNDVYGVQPFFRAHGYHVTHVFCGHSWMRATYAELLCDSILEPLPRAEDDTAPHSSQPGIQAHAASSGARTVWH